MCQTYTWHSITKYGLIKLTASRYPLEYFQTGFEDKYSRFYAVVLVNKDSKSTELLDRGCNLQITVLEVEDEAEIPYCFWIIAEERGL